MLWGAGLSVRPQESVVLLGAHGVGETTLLGEPSAGLSPQFVSELLAVLERFRGAALSLLIAEQNVAFLALADRVCTLESGRIGFEGTVEALHADNALSRGYFGLDGV